MSEQPSSQTKREHLPQSKEVEEEVVKHLIDKVVAHPEAISKLKFPSDEEDEPHKVQY